MSEIDDLLDPNGSRGWWGSSIPDPVDLPPQPSHHQYSITVELCAGISSLREDGMSYREISEEVGISHNTAWEHANDECDHQHRNTIDPARCRVVHLMEEDGRTHQEIADRFGVDGTTITYHVNNKCRCKK